ncbi:hypothetical protein C8Q72DRAFT_261062 [Fomitopsis betulina]|nr:hypothetical protein C8Q72DRAFT_261062 [Fomitopsis betulina]
MSSTFTPSPAIDQEKERDWAANLGMLDWDNTQILFSKRSLLEFLKYAGVTVDPNFTNIQKLPRYARFGTISTDGEGETVAEASDEAETACNEADNSYRPSRRVRTAPGGGHTDIFDNDADDALAGAPLRPSQSSPAVASPQATVESSPNPAEEDEREPRQRGSSNKSSGIGSLWDEPAKTQFKPTRRVREMPGGKDSISSLF